LHRGVRTDRHKLIHYYEAPEEFELYDLKTDPEEKRNLYGRPGAERLTQDLMRRLRELREETGDRVDVPNRKPMVPIVPAGALRVEKE
ncbi:MAG: DUF4976 domain-containing protein, partial [Armatimonadetes bacterium]|nr:DUF4976 domain-containing protein [Armatimonadota bacterium]